MKEKVEQTKKQKKDKDFFIIIIFLIILIITFLISFSLAKYITKVKGQAFAQIGKPIIELKGEESILITAKSPITSYKFEVRNYNENEKISEVEMKYYIEIVSKENEAIKYKLYNGEKSVELQNKKTKLITIPKENKQKHEYRLDIIYDKNKGENEDIKENIEIKIHSIQSI